MILICLMILLFSPASEQNVAGRILNTEAADDILFLDPSTELESLEDYGTPDQYTGGSHLTDAKPSEPSETLGNLLESSFRRMVTDMQKIMRYLFARPTSEFYQGDFTLDEEIKNFTDKAANDPNAKLNLIEEVTPPATENPDHRAYPRSYNIPSAYNLARNDEKSSKILGGNSAENSAFANFCNLIKSWFHKHQ